MSNRPTLLISGASRGLGAEAAFAAAQLGANLILTARSQDGLEATSERILQLVPDAQVKLISGDLANANFCQSLAEQAPSNLAGLILNAGLIDPIGPTERVDEEAWAQAMEVNMVAPFRLARRLIPALRGSRGRFVTVGTGAATQPIPSWGAYCASKAALLMFTKVVAAENPDITSFSFIPGVVNTTMQQTIRERKESMPAELAEYFGSLHETGQLEPPEVPGRALAWAALKAPKEWTGQEVQYSMPELTEQVKRAFES